MRAHRRRPAGRAGDARVRIRRDGTARAGFGARARALRHRARSGFRRGARAGRADPRRAGAHASRRAAASSLTMARTRTILDRFTAWSPVFLLGGLAALTYWLDSQVQPPPPRRDGSERHDPDIY